MSCSGPLCGEGQVVEGRLGHVGVRMLVRLEAVELPCLGFNFFSIILVSISLLLSSLSFIVVIIVVMVYLLYSFL